MAKMRRMASQERDYNVHLRDVEEIRIVIGITEEAIYTAEELQEEYNFQLKQRINRLKTKHVQLRSKLDTMYMCMDS